MSVVRRLSALDLAQVSALASLTEQELAELRHEQIGESILDSPPKCIQFTQCQQLVNEKVVKEGLSNLDAAKKLTRLNPKLSEEYFEKSASTKDIDQPLDGLDEA